MRKFIIHQLTQSSSWVGIIVMLIAFLFPRDWIMGFGLILILTPDIKLQDFFSKIRGWLESVWTG